MSNIRNKNIFIVFLNILIVTMIFLLLHFLRYHEFTLNDIYFILYYVFISLWILLSIYHNKYSALLHESYLNFIRSTIWVGSLSLFFITSIVSLTHLFDASRFFILQIAGITSIIEIILAGIYIKLFRGEKAVVADEDEVSIDIQFSEMRPRWIILGAFLLILTYFLLIRLKTGSFYLYPWSERILLILFGSWLISFLLTKKYAPVKSKNLFYSITPHIKASLILVIIASFVYYFFRIEDLSRFLLFGTIIVTSFIEISIFLVYYTTRSYLDENKPFLDQTSKNLAWELEDYSYDSEIIELEFQKQIDIHAIFSQLSSLENKDEIAVFLDANLSDHNISFYSSTILSTISIENIEILRNNSKNLILNLHNSNDIRYINQFLITIYSKLITDGIFVGNILPIDTTYNRLIKLMPKLIFSIYYPFHFLLTRIIPKLPKLNKIYYLITKGRNRAISKAEIFGRLNYCGFTILKHKVINERLFFIAKKVKTVSQVTNPSFHPIVKLNRVGYNGDLIKIHKFRTMHPYSEFIQKDIYEENELDIKGKFKDDFRITSWGKVMRRFWIDELPQLYDWLQGRLNLVGVRAISEHYFSLYPKEHQNFRINFKPGIIPPYYVDLPENIDEIVESERRYLLQKEKKPLLTDIRYGFKAIYNILIKGARSG